MIPKSHPYWHVARVVERHGEVEAVPASYYKYVPGTVKEIRTNFLIPVDEFLRPDEMARLLALTPQGQEFALHSNFRLMGGACLHIVMVDMATSARAHLDKLRSFLGDHYFQSIAWYSSGRSFHGYGEHLLSEPEWVKFMGLLLLINQPKLEPTVDPRWIGHRLLAGYSALRWTRNTAQYLALPKSIEGDTRTGTDPTAARFSKG
jgi:hypothetical protein